MRHILTRSECAISGTLVAKRPGHMSRLGKVGGKVCAARNRRRPNGQYKARGEK